MAGRSFRSSRIVISISSCGIPPYSIASPFPVARGLPLSAFPCYVLPPIPLQIQLVPPPGTLFHLTAHRPGPILPLFRIT